jgi:hypothetical protein
VIKLNTRMAITSLISPSLFSTFIFCSSSMNMAVFVKLCLASGQTSVPCCTSIQRQRQPFGVYQRLSISWPLRSRK